MKELTVLKTDFLELKVSPDVGAAIYSLKYNLDGQWVDIMRPTPVHALEKGEGGKFSSFNMVPYSNRVERAVLHHRGKSYSLQVDNVDGHSIHGDIRFRPLEVLSKDEKHIKTALNSNDFSDIVWPFPFYTEIEYYLDGDELTISMLLRNIGEEIMPAGMGIHPYFMRKLIPQDEKVVVEFPMKGVYPGETQIPTGAWVEIPEAIDYSHERELTADYLDRCYRAVPGVVSIKWIDSGVKMTMKSDDIFENLIVYCPKDDHDFFAVEPVTNCNNGFNMADKGVPDTGTLYLEPGEEIVGKIKIKISR